MRPQFLLLVLIILFPSCSTDSEDAAEGNEGSAPEAIYGTWDAMTLELDEEDAGEEAIYAKSLLEYLAGTDCKVLTFTFSEDGTVTTESKAVYLEVDFGTEGLTIPCPEEKDTRTGSYTYDGTLLVITDPSGESATIDARIENEVLRMDAGDLDEAELASSGELLLRKR